MVNIENYIQNISRMKKAKRDLLFFLSPIFKN